MERDGPLARLLPHVLQARGSDVLKRDDPALYTRVRHQLPHHQHSLPAASPEEVKNGPGEWLAISWGHYAHAVKKTAYALLALHNQSADLQDTSPRLAFFGRASPEYLVVHMACLSSGVVPITLPASLSAEQLSAALQHSQARYIFVDDREQLLKVKDKFILEHLHAIIYIQRNTDESKKDAKSKRLSPAENDLRELRNKKTILWRDFLRLSSASDPELLEKQMDRLVGGNLASVVYSPSFNPPEDTPKGSMYSHENVVSTATNCAEAMRLNERDILFSFSPISHISEQLLSIYCHILIGHRVYLNGESRDDVLQDIRSVQPTRLITSASFWKALHASFYEHLEQEISLPLTITRAASEIERAKKHARKDEEEESDEEDEEDDENDEEQEKESNAEEGTRSKGSWKSSRGGKEKREQPSFTIGRRSSKTEPLDAAKRKLNLKEVAKNPVLGDLYKQRMGLARLLAGYSSFTPLPIKVAKFFQKLGIHVYEVYAHPYATGFVSCNQSGSAEEDGDTSDSEDEETLGTVGLPLKESQVKLDTEPDAKNHGEILLKGKNVFMGFFNDKNSTREVLSQDGWVRTGDIGTLNDDGFIKLKGRQEDAFRLEQSSQTIFPWKVEKLLKSSPIIEDAVVLGNNRQYLTALLCLSSLSRALSQQDKTAAIRDVVTNVNGKLDDSCAIKKIATISPSTKLAHHPGSVSQYGRILRNSLATHFPKELCALYPDDAELIAAVKALEEMENRSSSSEEEESSESEEEEEEEVSPSAVREVEHDESRGLEHLEVKAPQETLEQIRVKTDQLPDTETEKKVENKAEPQWTKVKEVNRSTPAASPVTPRQSRALTIGESRTAQQTPTEDMPASGHEEERRVEKNEELAPSQSEPAPPQPKAEPKSVDQPKADRKEKPSAEDNAPGLGLSDLSEDIIIYLFSFLGPPELGSVALTCRKFRAALEDEVLWKLLLQRTYGTGGLLVSKYIPIPYPGVQVRQGNKEIKAVDWRNTFINRAKLWKAHLTEEPVERLALCARWGAVPLLRQLLDEGYSRRQSAGDAEAWLRDVLNKTTRIGGKTVLHWACEHGNSSVVEYLVSRYRRWLDLNAEASIASLSVSGRPAARVPHFPLSLASASGHLSLVQYLLEQEEVRTKCGVEQALNCLIAAADKEHESIVKYFLDMLHRMENNNEEGAVIIKEGRGDMKMKMNKNKSFVFAAKLWALELACERGNLRIVRDLISSGDLYLNLDLPPEEDDYEMTQSSTKGEEDDDEEDEHQMMVRRFNGLFRACERGAIKIVTSLLDRGLPVNMRELPPSSDVDETKDMKGRDDEGDDDEEDDDVRKRRRKGWTALHYAAKRGDLPLIQKLVARGADPSLTAYFGGRMATPLDVAETMDRDAGVVRYLGKITPRKAFYEHPDFILIASAIFFVSAVLFLLSRLLSFIV